jgi:adenylyltransferase/sulfurtransferase
MSTHEGRYSRQELFPAIGATGQQRIRAARVLITGCGGIGSNSASLLARAGVGFLRIVDREVVELSNLHRQSLFTEADVCAQLPKAQAAARHISAINSDVRVEPLVSDVDTDNILDLLDRVDLVLDGFDNFEGRYLLNDACVSRGVPWVYGSCVGATTMAALIVPGTTPCLRCLHRELPAPGSAATCETAGIIGPAAYLAASLEVALALRWIVNGSRTPMDTLIAADAWDLRLDRIPLPERDATGCVCCGLRKFEFLEVPGRRATSLCGHNAVQVRPLSSQRPDFAALADRLRILGQVRMNEFVLRLQAPPYELTLFQDGRAIVKGTGDENLARSLVAQWIGV